VPQPELFKNPNLAKIVAPREEQAKEGEEK